MNYVQKIDLDILQNLDKLECFLAKEMTDISYPDIGKLFGGKDHATVIHGVNKIKDLSETDNKLRQDLENIKIKLNSINSNTIYMLKI